MVVYIKITIDLRKLLNINAIGVILNSNRFLIFVFLCLSWTKTVAQCPTVQSFLVDACGKERQDEFMVINTGTNGFSISDLQLDFDSNNNNFGSLNNDIHINHGNNSTNPEPCAFVEGDASLMEGCMNVIAVSDGDYVPPNSILIVQLGNSTAHSYDFSALCDLGVCIYVTKNSCDRTSGVFSNSGIGDRTLVVSLSDGSGCVQTCTYDRAKLDDKDGAYFAPALAGNMQYGNVGCGVTPIVDWPLPAIALAGNDTSLCVKESMVVRLNGNIGGSAISAMWHGGDGDFNDVQLLDAEYYPTDEEITIGKVLLALTTNDFSGGVCQLGTSTIQINFDSLLTDIQLVKEFNGYGLACSGDSNGVIKALVWDGDAPYDYLWNFGENKSINSDLMAGAYRVTVIDAMGCLGASSFQLIEPERIKTNLEFFPEGCNDTPGKVVIDNIDGGIGSFDLFLGGAFQSSLQNGASPYQKNLASGGYQLVVVDENQCMDTVEFVIDEGYEFEVDLGPDVIIPQGKEVTVALNYDNNTVIEDINWTIDSLLDCIHCETITRFPLFSERVSVEVTDNNGCSVGDVMHIYVQPTGIYVPNVFSPNGDGINDYLTIFPSDQVATIDYFVLYNRYGSEIFHFSDEEAHHDMNIWDGYFKGKLMEPQAFIYLLRATFKDSQTEEYQGSITILH